MCACCYQHFLGILRHNPDITSSQIFQMFIISTLILLILLKFFWKQELDISHRWSFFSSFILSSQENHVYHMLCIHNKKLCIIKKADRFGRERGEKWKHVTENEIHFTSTAIVFTQYSSVLFRRFNKVQHFYFRLNKFSFSYILLFVVYLNENILLLLIYVSAGW